MPRTVRSGIHGPGKSVFIIDLPGGGENALLASRWIFLVP